MSNLVEVNQLVKRFGSFCAVDGITFGVKRGEVLGFLGPNGAGKSTTMKMITGFLVPDEGSVSVGGSDVQQDPMQTKRRIGYLPEGAPLYPDMTPVSLLDFIADIRGLRGDAKRKAIDSVIERVQLGDVLHKTLDTLSKGFKRRVGLAQAILHDPEVLILDEPTDGLDPNQKHEVRELIRQMSGDKAIILSTHILEEVEAVCSRNIVIAGGKVVADGTPAELEAMSSWHNAVTLQLVNVDADTVRSQLSTITDAADVTVSTTGGVVDAVVFPKQGTAVVESVTSVLRAQGWDANAIHVERGRLDDVFRDITLNAQSRG